MTDCNYSFVSLIIPCRNEEKYIKPCLDSILANDYPQGCLEIFIVDGMSEDRTRELIGPYLNQHVFMSLLDNHNRSVASAMNLGLGRAKGAVVFKMDAHAVYPKDYITRCVQVLEKDGVENVGGRFRILPGNNTVMAKNIALAVAQPFGIGGYYRWMSSLEVPAEVETVSFGCFRKEFLDKKKLFFNEKLGRGSDCEFNARLRKEGGRILLFPDIVFDYFGRTTLKELWKHQFSCGFWNLYGAKLGAQVTFRALIPLIALLGLCVFFLLSAFFPVLWVLGVAFLILYGLGHLICSVPLAIKQKSVASLVLLPIIFGVVHLSFASGSLCAALGFRHEGRK